MSDWAVGDLAVCVGSDDDCLVCGGPDALDADTQLTDDGVVHTVTAIDPPFLDVPTCGLAFDGEFEFSCSCAFRKVVSDKLEACEPEFVTLLKRVKRKQPVPALIEQMIADQERRHQWLLRAAEQIKSQGAGYGNVPGINHGE